MRAPYGSWSSPISTELMTSASVGLAAPTMDGDRLYWLEGRADQGGRTSIWTQDSTGARSELTPESFVRATVHEYGGGAFAVAEHQVVYVSFPTGQVCCLEDGQTRALTAGDEGLRFADLRIYPQQRLVLAIREDHRAGGEPTNTIIALDLDHQAPQQGRILCSGADFYSTPELSADGMLAWTEWDHPNMPWEQTRIGVGRLTASGLTDTGWVAAQADESAVQPRWTPEGSLIFISDRTGWWNLYRRNVEGQIQPICPMEAEFATPQWGLGMHPYAIIDNDQLLVSYLDHGIERLAVLQISTQTLKPIASEGNVFGAKQVSNDKAFIWVGYPNRPAGLSVLDLQTSSWTEVRRSLEVELDPSLVSGARPVNWQGPSGAVHGWFYPPTNPDFEAPEGSLPPLITMTHGGPTSMATPDLTLSYQYWTSRGLAILDVNYGGSSGFGRAYRQRLRGQWGVVDVADCASGAQAMVEQGLADPARLAIVGGSAGGYTTLRALTATNTFTAGISLYGIGDLETLATDTHKFESRYLDGLVGPYPEAVELYHQRSPIYHLDQLNCPVLLLQGEEDKVVPPNQASAMAAALRAKGLPVALIMFPGEGHGFRKAENVKASIQAQLYFLGKVFGFTPAEQLPVIEIENLPG